MGYQGNIRNIVNIMNYALFPRVLLLPAVLIFSVFSFAPVFSTFSSRSRSSPGRRDRDPGTYRKCIQRPFHGQTVFVAVPAAGGGGFFTMVLTVISIIGYFTA